MGERELPEGWEWKRLGDLIELKYGDGLRGDKREASGKIPVYGSNGIVGYHNKPLTTESCLIIGRKGSIGEVHLSEGPCWPIDTTYFVEPTPNIDLKFLFYLLKTLRLNSLDRSTAIPGLNRNDVYSKIIPLPPLPVQRQIVAVLEQAEAVKRQRQEADALTGALLQSVFYEMFGDTVRNEREWNIAKIEEICDEITVGIVVRPASYYVESGVPAFRSLNIRPDKLNLENFVYINSSDNDTVLAKSKIRDGDVLVVRTGYPGTACVVPPEFDGANCIDLIILRPKKQVVDCNYLSRFLNSEYGKAQALAGNTGLAQQHLNIGAIRQVKIPLPPLALQQQFARVVQEVEQIRERQTELKRKIDVLFEGLIAGAFSGKSIA